MKLISFFFCQLKYNMFYQKLQDVLFVFDKFFYGLCYGTNITQSTQE